MLASEISRSSQLRKALQASGSDCLATFADLLLRLPDCNIDSFLDSRPAEDRKHLAGLIAIELRHRFAKEHACRIEPYLEKYEELRGNRQIVIDLIYAEYCERRQRGEAIESREYYERFPDLQESLDRLFRIDSLMENDSLICNRRSNECLVKIPTEGSSFLEFRLKTELGRGTFGHVFLAEQTTLSDRRVILKITPRRTIEPQTLARLQHPNIVPILSTHYDESTGLRAVCMPYQHAVALSDVRDTWNDRIPTRGEAYSIGIMQAVDRKALPKNEDSSIVEIPIARGFVQTTAWIMQKLSNALHHAHLRGVYHRDIKPSNILLTITGQPLLMDFNLSFNRVESSGDPKEFFGGTLPYMPPEQIEVLHPVKQGRVDEVGPRADIYSLAATIFELLTGKPPFNPPPKDLDRLAALQSQLNIRFEPIPSARFINPRVPVDFDALLMKCLNPVPHERYESAAELANDLTAFLQDRQLRHVQVNFLNHGFYKFFRRNRRSLSFAAIATVSVLAVSAYLRVILNTAETERSARQKAQLDIESERKERAKRESQTVAEVRQRMVDRFTVLQLAAIEVDEAAARLTNDPNPYLSLGRNYFNSGKFEHAARCFGKVLSQHPNYSYAYYYRARCFANLDRDGEALDDFSLALKFNPKDMYSFLARAICYSTSRTHADPKRALYDLEKSVELIPSTHVTTPNFLHFDIARVYSSVSRFPEMQIDRLNLISKAKKHLLTAIELGLDAHSVRMVNEVDRFRMLDALLEESDVQILLNEHWNPEAGSN